MQSCTLQANLQFSWRKLSLPVVLSGKATAPPPSALLYANVKRTVSDFSDTPRKAGSILPQTPTGQKVVKSQRLGGISPGHPTFEAALRNSTAATPSRRRAADTPGMSRYAMEAAPDAMQAAPFADRLKEFADSPECIPVLSERPRLRLKRSAGTVPLRSLRLSVNQQAEAMPSRALVTKLTAAAAKPGEPSGRAGSSRAQGSTAIKGFSFFHSGYGC